MPETVVKSGTVENIVFHNASTGFTVFQAATEEGLVTAVAETLDLRVGELVEMSGEEMVHPTFGEQFKVRTLQRRLPQSAVEILRYLAAGAIKGIGPAIAQRLVTAFGAETLQVIENEPARLSEVRGISPVRAAQIAESYRQVFGLRSLMLFLAPYTVEPAAAIACYRLYGANAVEQLRSDPYLLCQNEIGVPFETADQMALALGLPLDAPCRLRGGVLCFLWHNADNGHCCLPRDKLCQRACALLDQPEEVLDAALQTLCQEGVLAQREIGGEPMLYLLPYDEAEDYIATRLSILALIPRGEESESCAREIAALEEQLGIRYAALQKQAIEAALERGLLILTGGPGTGKTTTLNGIVRLFERRGLKIGLAAPTGRAAKRMGEVTGCEAKTIHRLLEVDFDRSQRQLCFKRNEKNTLRLDVVIIDEMSMVDPLLFASLLRAMPLSARLVMVGDPDQLPSVGAGNLLRDLIDSDTIETIQLTEIFRQAAESAIVRNAHKVVEGELPRLDERDNDFFFLARPSMTAAADTAVELAAKRLPAAYGLSPLWDVQVIAPTRRGEIGTERLNERLQALLNPPDAQKPEFKLGSLLLRAGDKVMQTKNNYDLPWVRDDGAVGMGVFNGDIGIVEAIDRPAATLRIRFDERTTEYPFENAVQLELAYAITAHKSQGNEFEAVVIPLFGCHPRLYYRSLFYTAITRARRLLVLVGESYSVQRMVETDRRARRWTGLAQRLREAFS